MSNEDQKPLYEGQCGELVFHLNRYCRFEVPEMDKRFDSYQEMAAAIDSFTAAREASARKKIAIPAITIGGKRCIVTGVHAGHGGLTTKPSAAAQEPVYPDVGWVPDALVRLNEIEAQADRMRKLVGTLELRSRENRYGFKSSMHAEAVARLEAKMATVTKLVEKTSLDTAIEKTDTTQVEFD